LEGIRHLARGLVSRRESGGLEDLQLRRLLLRLGLLLILDRECGILGLETLLLSRLRLLLLLLLLLL
jgi:hypothetical protein